MKNRLKFKADNISSDFDIDLHLCVGFLGGLLFQSNGWPSESLKSDIDALISSGLVLKPSLVLMMNFISITERLGEEDAELLDLDVVMFFVMVPHMLLQPSRMIIPVVSSKMPSFNTPPSRSRSNPHQQTPSQCNRCSHLASIHSLDATINLSWVDQQPIGQGWKPSPPIGKQPRILMENIQAGSA